MAMEEHLRSPGKSSIDMEELHYLNQMFVHSPFIHRQYLAIRFSGHARGFFGKRLKTMTEFCNEDIETTDTVETIFLGRV